MPPLDRISSPLLLPTKDMSTFPDECSILAYRISAPLYPWNKSCCRLSSSTLYQGIFFKKNGRDIGFRHTQPSKKDMQIHKFSTLAGWVAATIYDGLHRLLWNLQRRRISTTTMRHTSMYTFKIVFQVFDGMLLEIGCWVVWSLLDSRTNQTTCKEYAKSVKEHEWCLSSGTH